MAAAPTYNAIFLPPTMAFQTVNDGINWVQQTFQKLLTPMTTQPGNPLTQSLTNPNHVTLIMTTEFAFNGFVDGGTYYNATAPLPLRLETAVRIEIQNQLRQLPRANNPRPWVLFVMSCAIDTGMVVNSGANQKTIGWNRVAIISSLTDDVQYVYKLQPPQGGDAGLVYDGWDFQRYVVSDGWSYFDPLNPTNPRRDTEGRLVEATYDVTVGDFTISIGFGTCLDSTLESYPGTNFIAFCGGGTEIGNIRDAFYESFNNPTSPVVWHLGFLINDTRAWDVGSSEWLDAGAGNFQWAGPTLQDRQPVPEENTYNMTYQKGSVLSRYLSVSDLQSIPPLPNSVPQTIGTMYSALKPDVITRLQTIVDLVLGSVPGSAMPYSVMDILRVYNARPRNGSTLPIPEVDAILTQCMVKILVPPKPVRTR